MNTSVAGPVVAGIDAGTSGCKGVLLGVDGQLVATAWEGYETRSGPQGALTQDAEDWREALRGVLRSLRAAAPGARVLSLSVTAPAHNVVLLDRTGEVIAPVMLWADPRPGGVAAELRERLGPVLRERAYVDLDSAWTLPQLVWIRQERPQEWSRVRAVLPAKDWLASMLTGERCTDPSDAAGTALYDARSESWSDTVLNACGLNRSLLPDIAPAASIAGVVRSDAKDLGWLEGVPVAVGATDTAAELLSVGAVSPGDGVVKIASTGTAVLVTDAPGSAPGVLVYPHAVDGMWYALTAMNTAGTAYRWVSELLGRDVQQLDAAAAEVPVGANGLNFLPHLAGERCPLWDPHATAGLIGVTVQHGVGDVARAVLEGVSLGLWDCLEHLRRHLGPVARPVLTGGGMRSAIWRQITVDVLGHPGVVRRPCEPALGAALLAAEAVGLSLDLQRETDVTVLPDTLATHRYGVVRERRDAWRGALREATR